MSIKTFKMVMVGDPLVGKTSLMEAYMNDSFSTYFAPTVFGLESLTAVVDEQTYTIKLHDTSGSEDYDRLRPLSYPQTDCILLFYSINRRSSFENITYKWDPEITHHLPRVPRVLIATKVDLRNELRTEVKHVSKKEGDQLRRKINAKYFVECSPKTKINVKQAIEQAVRACLVSVPVTQKEKKSCPVS